MAKTNKERLICIENKIDSLVEGFENHLDHHKKLYDRLFRIALVVFSVGLTAGVGIAVTLVFKSR